MRLLAYIRVSTEDQAREGHSLAQQPERLQAACIAFGHELVDLIAEADGVSGGVPLERRPGGNQLLRRLKAGEADGVIVLRLERIFRDLLDGLHFFRGFARKHGVQVVSLAEHIDTSTASGRLALNIHLLMADHERDKIGERTREVMDGLRQQGRVYGHVPYGCVAVEGALYRDLRAWHYREDIVALHGAGNSLASIGALLRRRGVPAPNGGDRWSKSTLAALIKGHDSLLHLPVWGQSPAPATAPPEVRVSTLMENR